MDFQKVKQSERERAERLASSAAGAAMEADARLEAHAAATSAADDNTAFASSNGAHTAAANGEANTFEPGEGKTAEESFATQFTMEEKAKIRDMVANAASPQEIDRIESLVKRGIFPGSSETTNIPPPPPPESDGKRSAETDEGEEEEGVAKRQKSE